MEYCVLVRISKNTIEFLYQIDGGEVEFLALSDKEQEIPLAFYLNGDEFIMGRYAMERLKMNDSNAFFHYFDLIRETGKTFTFAGVQRPIKQLLYLGVERYLSEFLRNKLILQDSSIDSNRANLPLRLCFNRDLTVPEKQAVLDLFRESGYRNVDVVETDMMLFNTISANNRCKLVLTGLDGDLYMNFFRTMTDKCEMSKMLEGIGSDPRYRICADLLYNEITISNPYVFIDKESNYESFLKEAERIFESTLPIVMGSVRLLSGENCDFSINKAILNERLKQMSASLTLLSETDYLLRTLNVGPNDVDVILEGGVNTNFFVEKLHEKYPCVYQMTDVYRRKIRNDLFAGIDFRPPKIDPPTLPGNNNVARTSAPPGLPTPGGKKLGGQTGSVQAPGLPTIGRKSSGGQTPPPLPGQKTGRLAGNNIGSMPPPPPPSSVQPKKSQVAPPPIPSKASVNQKVGGLLDAGKKTLSSMGDKIKTSGLKGGMMAGIKSMVANLSDNIVVVGRNGEQKVSITQTTVEQEHCTLKLLRNGKVEVEDLGSRNGTFVNDVRVTKAVVSLDDTIRLGPIFKTKVRDLLIKK